MKKLKIYAWVLYEESSNQELKEKAEFYKNNGVDGLMYAAGHDPNNYRRIGKIVKNAGLEFHAWIPSLIQYKNDVLKPEWYVINRLGESTYDKPPYVLHYQFVCPNREEIYDFLSKIYLNIALVDEVDGIHLDYIRFPDVILPNGLWKKYKLIMEREYPEFDYCYCDKCVVDFKVLTGINIKEVDDQSQIEEWKQFRYDLITDLVNHLAKVVRSASKQITAAVFPGPIIAKKNVRQEWSKWDIDALYLMNYNDFYLKRVNWIGKICKSAVESLNRGVLVYSGLFIGSNPKNNSSSPDPENQGLLPKELESAIKESMVNGAAGICLFSTNRMTANHWKVLNSDIQKEY